MTLWTLRSSNTRTLTSSCWTGVKKPLDLRREGAIQRAIPGNPDPEIVPDGKFLYAPNRGHNSIAGFRVNPDKGHLSAIGRTPTEAVPRAFSIDIQGTFMYVAGLETGKLASYHIDQHNGKLDAGDVYDVGKGPMWVLITEF